jgi:hypothetical protein
MDFQREIDKPNEVMKNLRKGEKSSRRKTVVLLCYF